MRIHTQGFKDQIKELGREIDSTITYGDNTILAEQLFNISTIINGNILKSAMKELHFESSIEISLYTVLKYEFGLKVSDKYEYLDYGNYIVKNIEYNEDTKTYSYTCYDNMLFSMKEYNKLQNGIFPMTIREFLTNLCLDCGLVFKNTNDTFANYDKVIQSDLYANLGYTYRDIFDELSQVTASTICVDSNNMVEVRYINETNDTIDAEYLKDVNVTFGKKYGPINSIVLSRSAESDNVYLQDEDSVSINGLCELKIIDNQIMNDNNRSDYLPDILSKLNGLEYYLNDYTSTGIMYYELCDKYNVKIGENIYNCILFNDEQKITQGLVEDIYTEVPNETETDYKKADKTDKKINQAYLIVDKQLGEIRGNVKKVETTVENITTTTQTSTGGNNLYITDSLESNALEYCIEGKCEQETRSGRNLYNFRDVFSITEGVTVDEDGWITVNYDNTNGTAIVYKNYYTNNLDLKTNAKYNIIMEVKSVSGTGNICIVSEYNSAGQFTSTAGYSFANLKANSIKTSIKTTKTSFDGGYSGLRTYCDFPIGANGSITFRLSVLEDLTVTSDTFEYEEHGGSPSPDYPSEIKTVPSIRNLFDASLFEEFTSDFKYIDLQLKPNTKYTMSSNIPRSSNNYGNVFFYSTNSSASTGLSDVTVGISRTITTTDDGIGRIAYRDSLNEYSNETTDYWYMIEEGSIVHDYVPYGTWAKVKITNEDNTQEKEVLIDLSKPNIFDNSLFVQGTPYDSTPTTRTSAFMKKVVSGETFTIKSNNSNLVFAIGFSDSNVQGNTTGINESGWVTDNQYTITSTKEGYLWVNIRYSDNSTITPSDIKTSDFVLYEGYDNYYELCSIGDIKDTLDIVNGTLTKRIDKVILNGSEFNWVASVFNNNLTDVIGFRLNLQTTNLLCDTFTLYNANYLWSANKEGVGIGSNYLAFYIKRSLLSSEDINGFKTWLSENPVTVYYELKELQQITLPIVNIPLFDGINHITLVDSLEISTSIKYLRNTPISSEYATNQQLDITNSNLSETTTKTNQNATDINETNANLNNNYYNKEQIDVMNTSTEQIITEIRNEVEMTTTATDLQISIIQEQLTNGVTSVRTETGYTFDKDGLKIQKEDSEMSSVLDNDGLAVKRDEEEVLTVRSSGVETENLKVRTYFTIGNNTRVEDYKGGTGFFYIGGAE